MKMLLYLGIAIGILIVIFLLGPKPDVPLLAGSVAQMPSDPDELEAFIQNREAAYPVRPDCESRIVWLDSSRSQTDVVLLYLHGFSASRMEGEDLARDFASRFGCNLYLPRLQAHGLSREEPLLDLNADSLYQSALDALSLARKLGQRVIVMATSTGGTLGLKLASQYPDRIYSLILYSPNVQIRDASAQWLIRPWGLHLARMSVGSNYRDWEGDAYAKAYWDTHYRLEAVQQLQSLVSAAMTTQTFEKVTQPLFLGYYYKNEEEQDQTVSVAALLGMYDQIGTPAESKRKQAFPDAGDHVIANPHFSGAFEAVEESTFRFAEEIIGLSPVSPAG